MKKPYFVSKRWPGLGCNRYGVILAIAGHPLAEMEFWPRDWNWRPLRIGFRVVSDNAINEEMWSAGYVRRGEVWTKPNAARVEN